MLRILIAFKEQIHALKGDDEGATAIEYGLIAALIAAVIVGLFATFDESLQGVFDAIAGALDDSASEIGGEEGAG